jgi:putative ABC transport system substrate-binding protein
MLDHSRRRFVALLGGGATWPIMARAQQSMPVIGFLSSRSSDESKQVVAAFHSGLQENGFVDGQNVAIEYRWAEGEYGRLRGLAAELVRRGVAVLVTGGGDPSALAAKAETSTIPIVFTIGGDPVKVGLVASLNRPGWNVTGVSTLAALPEAKRLGLLREVMPTAALFGVLINPSYPGAEAQSREVQEAGRTIARQIRIVNAANDQALETAFATLGQPRVDALLVAADPFLFSRRDRIVALAAQLKLPAIYEFRGFADAGGLMSYGTNLNDSYRQVGVYAGRVLKGAKPADLPVQQLIKFEFVINLRTAKALEIKFSDNVLSLADEVIE